MINVAPGVVVKIFVKNTLCAVMRTDTKFYKFESRRHICIIIVFCTTCV